MASHEQSFADEFNKFMRERALARGRQVYAFSLDGQDRDVGADYVLTDANRFAMVEFKYTASNLISESHKPRRLKLCQELTRAPEMRILHDRCHFIAWTQPPQFAVRLNVYRQEICTARVFGSEFDAASATNVDSQINATRFADDFLGGSEDNHLSLTDFDTYVQWVLTHTSGATKSNLELVTSDVVSGDLLLIRLNSLADAKVWLDQHRPSPPAALSTYTP